jgi:hypothetical protein
VEDPTDPIEQERSNTERIPALVGGGSRRIQRDCTHTATLKGKSYLQLAKDRKQLTLAPNEEHRMAWAEYAGLLPPARSSCTGSLLSLACCLARATPRQASTTTPQPSSNS